MRKLYQYSSQCRKHLLSIPVFIMGTKAGLEECLTRLFNLHWKRWTNPESSHSVTTYALKSSPSCGMKYNWHFFPVIYCSVDKFNPPHCLSHSFFAKTWIQERLLKRNIDLPLKGKVTVYCPLSCVQRDRSSLNIASACIALYIFFVGLTLKYSLAKLLKIVAKNCDTHIFCNFT